MSSPGIRKIRGWNQAQTHKETRIQAHIKKSHTIAVLIPEEAYTNCQLSILWLRLIKCGAQNASWILINVLSNKTLRLNGHRMRGTEQKKKKERKRETDRDPNCCTSLSPAVQSVIFHNKRVKWRTSSNVWFNAFPQTQSTPKHMDLMNFSLSLLLPLTSLLF